MWKLTEEEIEYFRNTLELLLVKSDDNTRVKMLEISHNLIKNYNYLTDEERIVIVEHLIKGARASLDELLQTKI